METGSGNNGRNRIALKIQYDGTNFAGSQIQKNARTVQGELERALAILTKENHRIIFSSRTDAGVHALEQVAHLDLDGTVSLQRLCIALNGIVEKDVSVVNAYRVPARFHARFSATEREYIYCIYNNPNRSPFARWRAHWARETIDVDYVRAVLALIEGEADFASFCKKKSALTERSTVRRITGCSAERYDDMLLISIRGNAFLHNMIRVIVGTTLWMYTQGKRPEYILEVLTSNDRAAAGFTAPPYGLYLRKIYYNPPLTSMNAAF